jgi:hypothetical protein
MITRIGPVITEIDRRDHEVPDLAFAFPLMALWLLAAVITPPIQAITRFRSC